MLLWCLRHLRSEGFGRGRSGHPSCYRKGKRLVRVIDPLTPLSLPNSGRMSPFKSVFRCFLAQSAIHDGKS